MTDALRRAWLSFAVAVCLAVCLVLFASPATAEDAQTRPDWAQASEMPDSLVSLRALEAQVVKTAKQVFPAVVGVNNSAGVIISKDGVVFTAAHLGGLRGGKVTIRLSDGKTMPGKTLGMNGLADAAVVKIQAKGPFPFARLGVAGGIKPGRWCVMYGHKHPRSPGRPALLRLGRVVEWDKDKLISNCSGAQGDSGGPLFDLSGRLIGINSYGSSRMGHVPVDFFTQNLKRLMRGDRWGGRPRLVFSGAQLTRRRPTLSKSPQKLLATLAEASARSIVRVLCKGKPRCLGTVVSGDGLIATKSSELTGALRCRLHDGSELDAKRVRQIESHDLAFLQVEARKLTPISWTDAKRADIGWWVVAPGPDGGISGGGIIMVAERSVPSLVGALGAWFAPDAAAAPKLGGIQLRSPAAKAALKVGDLILAIDGQETPSVGKLKSELATRSPGDEVKLRIRRGEQKIDVKVELAVTGRTRVVRAGPGGRIGGIRITTPRRTSQGNRHQDGFPAACQHGASVSPGCCGAPLVGLDGKALGLHIASGSSASYALPAAVVIQELAKLRTGCD